MLQDLTIRDFLKELASKKPVPGGGSASALAGAVAAGLIAMSAKYADDPATAEKAEKLKNVLADLADEDAKAFKRVVKEKFSRDALKEAIEVPLQTARYSYEVLKLASLILHKSCSAGCDVKVAELMAKTAIEGAILNAEDNIIFMKIMEVEDGEFTKKTNEARKTHA